MELDFGLVQLIISRVLRFSLVLGLTFFYVHCIVLTFMEV